MQLLLVNPRGFCAGVSRAVATVENVLKIEKSPIYVRHEVVHNRVVVNSLKEKGVVFVKELNEVPDGAVCIFSAHGVSLEVEAKAEKKGLILYDATCPLVNKVHREVKIASKVDAECVLIGHKGHPEVQGTMGQYTSKYGKVHLVENTQDVANLKVQNPNNLHLVTQTTLSVDDTKDTIEAVKENYPVIKTPYKEDICYATQNRQAGVKAVLDKVDVFVAVGSKNSSNSNRLSELAKSQGIDSYLVDDLDDIKLKWFENKQKCGLTAGASAPEKLVQDIISKIVELTSAKVVEQESFVSGEEVVFPLPKLLQTKMGLI